MCKKRKLSRIEEAYELQGRRGFVSYCYCAKRSFLAQGQRGAASLVRGKLTGNEVLVFEEMTDKDGNFEKSALNPELSWDVEFVLPNYVPQKISDIDLERGTIDILDVTLVPVV